MTFAKQYPSTVEVPAVQPTQLPNLPGNGGITVTNLDAQFSADVSTWQAFPAGQAQTLAPHQSTIFAEGSPVWARVTPGQAGSPASIELGIWPGAPSAPQGAVDVANEVTINGTVDVGTITGTVDANITNANIPVSGTVDVSTAAGSTVDVTGSTVNISAGQVVEVTNEPNGSLTVAGAVDIGTVTGTVTIDANGSDITVDQVPQGTLIATIPANSTTFNIPAASIGTANTLTFIQAPSSLGATDVDKITSVVQTNAPNASLPFGLTSAVINGVFGYLAAVVDLVDGSAVTVNFLIGTVNAMYVYASSGIDSVVASVSNLPLVAVQGANSSVALQVRPGHTIRSETVANPAAGADWSYTLPFDAKLVAVTAELATSATTATRYPQLRGIFGPNVPTYAQVLSMTSAGLPASTTANFQGWPGPPSSPVYNGASPGFYLFPVPDFVLPTGAIILSSTLALQAGDQWSGIILLLEPA